MSHFVTHGSTPLCGRCGLHYSSHSCVDCALTLCTWCDLSVHEAIGARNHQRPKLYDAGDDDAKAWSPPPSSVQQKLAALTRVEAPEAQEKEEDVTITNCSFADGFLQVTTSFSIPYNLHDAWELLGDWDMCWVNAADSDDDDDDAHFSEEGLLRLREHCVAHTDLRRRVRVAGQVYDENLTARSERECYYTYTTHRSSDEATALLSKFAFKSSSSPNNSHQSSATDVDAAAVVPSPSYDECTFEWSTSCTVDDAQWENMAAVIAKYHEAVVQHMENAFKHDA